MVARSFRIAEELARGVKTCSRCKQEKPLSSYSTNGKSAATGLPVRRPSCYECAREVNKKWRDENPVRVRDLTLNKLYGITVEQYGIMLVAQGSVCAICRQPEPAIDHRTGDVRRLSVDHCHDTGAVRGLLCTLCNQGIGQFKNDPELLRSAIRYLQVTN